MSAAEHLDLDDWLADGSGEYDPDIPPPLAGDLDMAERQLRRVARLDADLAQMEAIAKARTAEIAEWLRRRREVIDNERAWRLHGVEQWMRAEYARTGTQTRKLPSGTLSLKAARTTVEALADPTFDTPAGFVRTKLEWDKATIARLAKPGPELDILLKPGRTAHAAVTATGEVVPGVALLVADEPTFTASTKAGSDE